MSDGRLLGQDQIAELFGELDEMLRLSSGLQSLELGVVGGAALVLRWGLRATYDVDFVSENLSADVRRSAAEIAARRGIQTDWLNDAAKGFTPNLSFNGTAVFEGNVLKVLVPDGRYLLAMKLFSSRETDLGDAVFLARQTGASDLSGVWLVEEHPGGIQLSRSRSEFRRSERDERLNAVDPRSNCRRASQDEAGEAPHPPSGPRPSACRYVPAAFYLFRVEMVQIGESPR